jgi:hypothetical protein
LARISSIAAGCDRYVQTKAQITNCKVSKPDVFNIRMALIGNDAAEA